MRVSMVDALQAVGYEVQEAGNGMEGLAKVQESQFDLVITDLRMPGADGIKIIKTCREQVIPPEVIVITAHGSVDTAVDAMKSGAYDYITKPFSMEETRISWQPITAGCSFN
jgi:two-component system, NtrC family, response regulator AtoC